MKSWDEVVKGDTLYIKNQIWIGNCIAQPMQKAVVAFTHNQADEPYLELTLTGGELDGLYKRIYFINNQPSDFLTEVEKDELVRNLPTKGPVKKYIVCTEFGKYVCSRGMAILDVDEITRADFYGKDSLSAAQEFRVRAEAKLGKKCIVKEITITEVGVA